MSDTVPYTRAQIREAMRLREEPEIRWPVVALSSLAALVVAVAIVAIAAAGGPRKPQTPLPESFTAAPVSASAGVIVLPPLPTKASAPAPRHVPPVASKAPPRKPAPTVTPHPSPKTSTLAPTPTASASPHPTEPTDSGSPLL